MKNGTRINTDSTDKKIFISTQGNQNVGKSANLLKNI